MQINLQAVDCNTLVAEFIKIFPNCVLIFLIILAAFIFRRRLRNLFDRLTHFGAFGVEVEFGEAKAQLRSAILTYKKDLLGNLPNDVAVDEAKLHWILNRAERTKDLLQGSSILWVDDQPLANAAIFRFLNDYGVVIDCARTTEEALGALKWSGNAYEVIISDMVRNGNGRAGLDLLDGVNVLNDGKHPDTCIVVLMFVYRLDSKVPPVGSKIITNKVDELLEEIIAVIERQHLQQAENKS